ncbi:MAG: transglycosylase domain-containing protein, partial [Beijerinckiaceae bacterium]
MLPPHVPGRMLVLSLLQSLTKWLFRLVLVAVLSVAALVIAGRMFEMPSTLMLWRWYAGAMVERQWVPLETMSPHLVRAVITSEDQLFCVHSGVDWEVIRELINDPDGPSRGGSTIAMQTV